MISASSTFARSLIDWQRQHGRHDLPWQGTRDAYRVWLSEVMLQQTQVATVLHLFPRFVACFPDVRTLAAAPVEAVLALWAGMGYYARARNLHLCARRVVANHAGNFPQTAAELATLPGIGRSTAAAIAVFVSHERAAILDGNVKRVFCRHFAIEGAPVGAVEKTLWKQAEALLPAAPDMPAYTQGLMDLGATLCTRRAPRCPSCPLARTCLALRQNRAEDLPAPRRRIERPRRLARFLLISDGARVFLQRRPMAGVWGGLYTLPEDISLPRRLGLSKPLPLPPRTHVFTHFCLEIHPVCYRVAQMPVADDATLECLFIDEALKAGVPAPIARLLLEIAPPLESAPLEAKANKRVNSPPRAGKRP
ncbi:MAG: A/G-specific adenine glycosylase [Zoogloeaceae bacterium]|jgi:A/G-specific adenine glycosylase|nr:A/G-specific adenine glycosylase [Zoogloeaceae bacterium]